MKHLKKLGLLVTLISLVGCVSKTTSPEQYSGFLSSYTGLQEQKSASGKKVLRWVDPAFKDRSYDSVIYNPVVFYPESQLNPSVDHKVLNSVLSYTDKQIKAAMLGNMQQVTVPGPHTLIFRGAVTAVNTNNQGMQFYEVLPVAALIAGTQVMTGHRTMDTNLYFEGELIDSVSKKTMLKVIRKNQGEQLRNESQKISISDLKEVIDNMARDFSVISRRAG